MIARALVAAIAADAAALAELRALVATGGEREYSQLDAERPAGVGRARYLRAWRRGRDAGDPECRADGRARTMTPAAWARWGAAAPTRRAKVCVVGGDLADLLAELGAA